MPAPTALLAAGALPPAAHAQALLLLLLLILRQRIQVLLGPIQKVIVQNIKECGAKTLIPLLIAPVLV